jgi:protein pelota
MLQIRVKGLDFDPNSSQLHVSGQIMNETQHTRIGQHHTLDLELNRNFTLEKEVGAEGEGVGWDSIAIDMLKDAVDESGKRRAEAVAVVMQEGLAHICFITQFQTILKQKVEMSIPRKRAGGGDHDKVGTFLFKLNRVQLTAYTGTIEILSSHLRYIAPPNRVQYKYNSQQQ